MAATAGAVALDRAEALQGPPQSQSGAAPSAPAVRTEALQASAEPQAPLGPLHVPDAPPPWELLSPLAVGSTLARGWRVADLSEVIDGGCVLTLRNQRGRTHRVHLCGHAGRPQGLVYTDRIDLLVMNGGQGELPTDEGLAQAVAEVAHVLAANEGDRRQARVVAALLPQGERVERFASTAGLR